MTSWKGLLAVLMGAALTIATLGMGAHAAGSLQASGVIQVEEVRIASEFQGSVDAVTLQAGDPLTAGQTLLTLDSPGIRASVEQAQAAADAAQADLDGVRAEVTPAQTAARRAQLALAQAEQSAADAAWRAANAALREPQELQAQILQARGQAALAAQNVQLAEAQAAQTQAAADQAEWNSPQRHILELQAASAHADVDAAKADERAAQLALQGLQDMLDRPLAWQAQAHAAEGKLRVSVAATQVRQAELDDLLAGATQEDLALAEAKLALAQAQLALAQAQSERLTLRSPVTGTLLERYVNAGETALPGITLFTVADLSEVYLVVYVPENHVGEVMLGQKVNVTVDSFPSRRFEGSVVHIAEQAQYTPRNVATKEERVNTVYGVKILLPNPDGALKSGMAADVTFRSS